MAKVIRLTESDLVRLVKKVIKEQNQLEPGPAESKIPSILFNKLVSGLNQSVKKLGGIDEVNVKDLKGNPEKCQVANGICCKRINIGVNQPAPFITNKSDFVSIVFICDDIKNIKINVFEGPRLKPQSNIFPFNEQGVQQSIEKAIELKKKQSGGK